MWSLSLVLLILLSAPALASPTTDCQALIKKGMKNAEKDPPSWRPVKSDLEEACRKDNWLKLLYESRKSDYIDWVKHEQDRIVFGIWLALPKTFKCVKEVAKEEKRLIGVLFFERARQVQMMDDPLERKKLFCSLYEDLVSRVATDKSRKYKKDNGIDDYSINIGSKTRKDMEDKKYCEKDNDKTLKVEPEVPKNVFSVAVSEVTINLANELAAKVKAKAKTTPGCKHSVEEIGAQSIHSYEDIAYHYCADELKPYGGYLMMQKSPDDKMIRRFSLLKAHYMGKCAATPGFRPHGMVTT